MHSIRQTKKTKKILFSGRPSIIGGRPETITSGLEQLTSAILEFYFRFHFRAYHSNQHNILHQPAKFRRNRDTYNVVMTFYRFYAKSNGPKLQRPSMSTHSLVHLIQGGQSLEALPYASHPSCLFVRPSPSSPLLLSFLLSFRSHPYQKAPHKPSCGVSGALLAFLVYFLATILVLFHRIFITEIFTSHQQHHLKKKQISL